MKKRFFALVTLVVIMLASCFAFIACNKSKGGSGNGGGKISASSNSSSITTPSGGDISKVDVFTENAEYKVMYRKPHVLPRNKNNAQKKHGYGKPYYRK